MRRSGWLAVPANAKVSRSHKRISACMRLSFAPGDSFVALKEVVRAGDPHQSLRLGRALEDCGQQIARGKLVVVAADEELGRGALREEAVGVVSPGGVDRQTQRDQPSNARIAAADAQANLCAEGESREENGTMELRVEPVEGGAHVFLLAVAVVVLSLAKANAAKVEAQHGQAEG